MLYQENTILNAFIVGKVLAENPEGLTRKGIEKFCDLTEHQTRHILEILKKIDCVGVRWAISHVRGGRSRAVYFPLYGNELLIDD